MSAGGHLRRPWGVSAFFAALVLAGLVCWPRLPVNLLPRLPHPSLTVVTTFENASPQEVDTLLTRRLESVLGTVSGVIRLESLSAEGVSRIRLVFDWGRDLGPAAAEVREKLDSVADQLPRRADPPLVLHYDPSQAPVMTLALTGEAPGVNPREVARHRLKTRLETVAGVAAVRLAGGEVPEVQVLADRGRLVALKVDLGRVVEALSRANLNAPAGELRLGKLELPVRTVGRFTRPGQIEMVPLRHEKDGSLVLVGDVARAVVGHKDLTGFCRVNGRPAVLLSVLKEPLANTVEVSRRVRAAVAELAPGLPAGLALSVVDDQAPFIAGSLRSLGRMVLWGGGLAFLLLLVYLRNLGRALLVVLSAPVALLSTLGFMHLFGVGLNLMSIGGLALGVGMLVDGSIVVLEAFQRHRAGAQDALPAAQAALSEVRGGLVCGALVTSVVLVPILFLTGLAQRLFLDFAFTLVASLILSLATALYLLPALLVWLDRSRGGAMPATERETPQGGYASFLERLLAWRWLVVLLSLAAGGAGLWLLDSLGASLLPELAGGRAVVKLDLPPESGLGLLRGKVARVEKLLQQDPAVKQVVTRAGVDPEDRRLAGLEAARRHQARLTLQLAGGGEATPKGVLAGLRRRLAGVKGIRVQVAPAGVLELPGGGGMEAPELMVLLGDDWSSLRRVSQAILQRLAASDRFSGLQARGISRGRQIVVQVDRPAAALSGISVSKVARTVSQAVQGEVAGQLLQGDRRLDIRVRLRPQDRRDPAQLAELPVMAPSGAVLLLNQVARLKSQLGPLELLRRERRPAASIRGRVAGGPFSRGQDLALELARRVELPSGMELRPGAAHSALAQSLGSLGWSLLLALGLTYLLLVIRFESLSRPLVILLGLLPLSLGPALALELAGLPVSALVLLGGVVLLGMAANGSILLVDYAEQLRGRGLAPRRAVARAAGVRLRPLLLSVATTVLGALPLCLGWGSGGAMSRPLALTVVAGLLFSLAASLLLVPSLYDLLAGRRRPQDQGGTA